MIADLLIELGWKSALACGVALLAGQALRGRPAAQRVAVLRAGVAALLLLPLLVLVLPAVEVAVLPATGASAALPAMDGIAAASVATPVAPVAPGIDWIALAYLGGAAFVLLRLAVGLFLLHRWTRHAVPTSHPVWREVLARAAEPLRRPVRLLVSPRIGSPLSLGIAPATILIGPDIERRPDRAAAVIAHEIAHVRRLDWLAMLAARLALALFWCNPFAWLLVVELARQTELAADEEALRHVGRADYAQTLLAVAGGCGVHAACGMAVSHGAMARRIRRVLDAAPRKPASRLLCAALIGGIPLGIAPLAAMQVVERPQLSTVPEEDRAVPRPAPAVPPPEVREEAVRTPVARAPLSPSPWRDESVRATAKAKAAARLASAPPPSRDMSRAVEAEARSRARAPVPAMGETAPPAGTGAQRRVAPPTEQRLAAVQRLRKAALEYRDRAHNPDLPLDIRQGYRNVAASLADEADRLERQAKQMAGVY
ncbi:MAG: M56 family metallopeptidase [Sphingomonas sp.]|uniref:M56 family metallopeptidase n=1 Tax=Sphingomonas sp. TaxID=28214 RepID=UPI0025EA9A35|nr:M56 family metallopeptidase [Sphingomonas sp.]MBQ1500703.1 M56 family metallopeptidase [Sphingomonas sp.]